MKVAKPTRKASMIAAKDRAIVLAAHDHFLRDGFAAASMDAIARSAGVSVKTIYSHFAGKDELFSKVMIAACTDNLLAGELPSVAALAHRFAWFRKTTRQGLFEAGREYLGHLLSPEQLALYRVVTRDADRFPELGQQYRKNFAQGRTAILIAYLTSLAQQRGWPTKEAAQHAALYEALLRAGIYEDVLHGLAAVSNELIDRHAQAAARTMWKLLSAQPQSE